MPNFGTVYTFFKSEFLGNEHGDPPFSFIVIYKRHDELCICKVLKKICPLEEFVINVLNKRWNGKTLHYYKFLVRSSGSSGDMINHSREEVSKSPAT